MLRIYTVTLFLLSMSVLFMPVSTKSTSNIPVIINGIIFWMSVCCFAANAVFIHRCRKRDKYFNQLRIVKIPIWQTFFTNQYSLITDTLMIVSLVGIIITAIFDFTLVLFIFLATLIFTFGMHFVLNGKTYKYLTYKVRRKNYD